MATTTSTPAAADRTESAATANEKVVIPVTGMTCASCQARVQRSLAKTAGVSDPFMRWAMPMFDPGHRSWLRWAYSLPPSALAWGLFALTLGVMGWAGRHFYSRAWAAFRHHAANMDPLVAVGTGAAFVYSLIATAAPGFFLSHGIAPDVYYEAVIIIIALILTGNAFEARAKRQTSSALRALPQLQPKTARLLRGADG